MPLVNRLQHQYSLPTGVINTRRLHRHEVATRALGDRLLQRLAWPTQRLARYQMGIAQPKADGWGPHRFQRREVVPTLGDLGWSQPHRPAIAEIQRSGVPAPDRSVSPSDLSYSPGRSPELAWIAPVRVASGPVTLPSSMLVRQPTSLSATTSPPQVQGSTATSTSISDVTQPAMGGTFRIQRRAGVQLSPTPPPAPALSNSLPLAAPLRLTNTPTTPNRGELVDPAIYRAVVTNPLCTEPPTIEPPTTAAPTSPTALTANLDSEPASAVPPSDDRPLALLPLAPPLAGVVPQTFPSLVQRYALNDVLVSSSSTDTAPLPVVRPVLQRRLRRGDHAQSYPLGTVLIDSGAKSRAAAALSLVSPKELVLTLPPQTPEPSLNPGESHRALDAETPVVKSLSYRSRSQSPNHLQALPVPQTSISPPALSPLPLSPPRVAETISSPLPLARQGISEMSQIIQRQENDSPEMVASETISGTAPPASSEPWPPSPPMDAGDMADQVSRILSRQLAVEQERRGVER